MHDNTMPAEDWNNFDTEPPCTHYDGPTMREIQESIRRAEELEKRAANQATRGDALLEAHRIVNGARQDAYGSPEDCFSTIAQLWYAYMLPQTERAGHLYFTPHNVAVMLSLLKVGRIAHNPAHHDSHVDGAAYLALADDMSKGGAE